MGKGRRRGEKEDRRGGGEGGNVLGWQVRPNEVREEERSEPKGT